MSGGSPSPHQTNGLKVGTHKCHARSTIADGGSPAASTPVLSLALASQAQSAVCLALMYHLSCHFSYFLTLCFYYLGVGALIASGLRPRHVYVYELCIGGDASLPPLHLYGMFRLVGLLWLMWLALTGLGYLCP